MRDVLEFGLVFGVGLDAEGGGEDELADGCAEAGEEGVEGLGGLVSRCTSNDQSAAPKVFSILCPNYDMLNTVARFCRRVLDVYVQSCPQSYSTQTAAHPQQPKTP